MRRVVWIIAALLAALAPAASAEKHLIDRVVAVVEDEAIFQSDVDQMVKQYMIQQGRDTLTPDEQKTLEQKILEQMIDDKLVIAEAGRLNITIPFKEVEEKVNSAIEDNKKALGGEKQFETQMKQEGFTLESLKDLYRKQIHSRMLVDRVLQMQMGKNRQPVSEEELHKFFDERKDQLPKRPEVVHLETILIPFSTSDAALQAAKQKILALRDSIEAGESFAELARRYSEDPSKASGGDLGYLKPQDLREPAFARAADSLKVGEVSQPVLTSYGYHLIKVTDKKPDTGEIRVSHILIRVTPSEQDVNQVFKKATAVREQLASGAPFDSLAKAVSTDPSASDGGDLGWIKVADLPAFFQNVLSSLKAGDLSPVLRESTGFRIVKLLGREAERPYTFSEIHDQLEKLYRQSQMASVYDDYIAKLRKKFTVDIKVTQK